MHPSKRLYACVAATVALLFPCFPAHAMGFSAEAIYHSVFVITTESSLGSGFAIGSNSILTNAHVVENAESIVAEAFDGALYACHLKLYSENLDIALLVVDGVSFTPISVADNAAVEIGDDVYAIGAPNSMAYTLTKGIVSSKERKIGPELYIQIDASLSEGSSGGPLLNDKGEVLGINSRKVSNSEGIGLAIPMTVVCAYLEQQGFSLDGYGNISSVVESTEELVSSPSPDERSSEESSGSPNKNNPTGLIIALCTSVGLNITLLLLLIRTWKKNKIMPNPSERTDFDIEITG